MNSALRPMSTAEVLDRTFHLYRSNFVLFIGISMVAQALTLVMQLAILGTYGTAGAQGGSNNGNVAISVMIALISTVMYLVGHALASGATAHAVSLVHLGSNATIHESYMAIRRIFLIIFRIVASVAIRGIGPSIIVFLVILVLYEAMIRMALSQANPGTTETFLMLVFPLAVAFAAALVWMVYVFSKYALAVPACALERISAKAAMKRSRFLTKKSLGRNALVIILTGIISNALAYLFELPVYIAHHTWVPRPFYLNLAQLLWTYFAGFAAGALAGPIAAVAFALLYYDERIRKEAFDLQWMMQLLEPSGAQEITLTSSGAGVAT